MRKNRGEIGEKLGEKESRKKRERGDEERRKSGEREEKVRRKKR